MTPPNPDADAAKLPWPGEELVNRVAGTTDRAGFYISGRQSVCDLEAVLSLLGRQLSDYRSILDFGCGCGRIMLWLEHLSGVTALHGVDIDERAVEWSRHHMPWATFKTNQPLPPLDYPDGSFDLVFNHSVFTHIDEDYQDQWLTELRRVVAPGGHVILSVHGERAFHLFEENVGRDGVGNPGVVRQQLSTRGIAFIEDDAFTGGPFPDFYHSTFHAPWYIFQHWGRILPVAAYVPGGSLTFQDFVLLERPLDADGVVRGEPISVQPAVESLRADAPLAAATATAGGVVPVVADDDDGLHRAGRLLHDGYDAGKGEPGVNATARRLLDRAVRSRADYQHQVDEALFTAIYEMRAALDQRTTGPGGVPLAELNARLWDALRLQGERINRLEADLWDALKAGPSTP